MTAMRRRSPLGSARPQLLADVATRDREAKSPSVPLEPVEGYVIGNEAVVDEVSLAAVQKLDGRQKTFPKDLSSEPRGGRCRWSRLVDGAVCTCPR